MSQVFEIRPTGGYAQSAPSEIHGYFTRFCELRDAQVRALRQVSHLVYFNESHHVEHGLRTLCLFLNETPGTHAVCIPTIANALTEALADFTRDTPGVKVLEKVCAVNVKAQLTGLRLI